MTATIKGVDRLRRKLAQLPEAAKAAIRIAMEKAGDDMVAMARNLVPVSSGDLRDSIGWTWGEPPKGSIRIATVKGRGRGRDLTLTVFAGNDKAYYARWIEFGTAAHANGGLYGGSEHPGTAARPFFFVSFRATRKRAKRTINKAIRDSAKRVAAGGAG